MAAATGTSVSAFWETASYEERWRITEVGAAQTALGMQPRDDSRLTLLYASGCPLTLSLYSSAQEVAEELYIVDAIYRTTLYGETIEEVMRAVAAWLLVTYDGLTYRQAWDLVVFYVPTMLKLYYLDACPPS